VHWGLSQQGGEDGVARGDGCGRGPEAAGTLLGNAERDPLTGVAITVDKKHIKLLLKYNQLLESNVA
jgi:hypothetical protein